LFWSVFDYHSKTLGSDPWKFDLFFGLVEVVDIVDSWEATTRFSVNDDLFIPLIEGEICDN
jgi:hypothetical protein